MEQRNCIFTVLWHVGVTASVLIPPVVFIKTTFTLSRVYKSRPSLYTILCWKFSFLAFLQSRIQRLLHCFWLRWVCFQTEVQRCETWQNSHDTWTPAVLPNLTTPTKMGVNIWHEGSSLSSQWWNSISYLLNAPKILGHKGNLGTPLKSTDNELMYFDDVHDLR